MKSEPTGNRVLLCNCRRTMQPDGEAIARALGHDQSLPVYAELCRADIATYEAALKANDRLVVACGQEAALFREVADARTGDSQDATPDLRFVDIRDRAGWCETPAAANPKMAALLADAVLDIQPAGMTTLTSHGVCLVYGAGQAAMDAATALADRLSVSLLLTNADDIVPPRQARLPVHIGRLRAVSGHLGAFEVRVDGYAPALPSSRGGLEFALTRDGASSSCDLILDMSGGPPLFADHARRDGYVRADPANPASVAHALFAASDLVGEFEKPLYVGYDAGICAHARSQKIGCRNCIDICPTGAISPDGDHVTITPAICGGCGGCSAVCPTGAVSYAFPRRYDLAARIQTLASTYLDAGGKRPVLLVHDDQHGSDLLSAVGRFGRGVPPNVLPLTVSSIQQIGHDALAAAFTAGFEQVIALASPAHADELLGLEGQMALTETILTGLGYGGQRTHLLVEADPDLLETALWDLPPQADMPANPLAPQDSKRDLSRMAFARLHESAPGQLDIVTLPDGAPYGIISVDTGSCTLCLACVGACPANALAENSERPEVAFTEAACVQCGICSSTCPENAIQLQPRYNFTPSAFTPIVLHSEEPFACISCGKPFGVKSTVEAVVERLSGKHWMYKDSDQARLIQMCDDCRIETMATSGDNPLASGEPPRMRTTDDYIEAEEQAKKTGRKPDDFLN